MAGTSVSGGGGTLSSGGTRTGDQDRSGTPRDDPPAGTRARGREGRPGREEPRIRDLLEPPRTAADAEPQSPRTRRR